MRPASNLLLALTGALCLLPTALRTQAPPAPVPFGIGEELVYRASSTRFGKLGTGVMSVAGPEEVRGARTYLLRFDFRGKVGPAVVNDRTRSWLDPERMASLRYTKTERSPVTRRDEDVTMDPAARRWESARGGHGAMASAQPLDELSFLFFVRTLPLADGASYDLARHFDARRNPVRLRVVRRARVTVPAGSFDVVEVEMRVKDPGRFGGEGVIRMHLTDDARRIPVRIDSSMPFVGGVALSLESHTPGR